MRTTTRGLVGLLGVAFIMLREPAHGEAMRPNGTEAGSGGCSVALETSGTQFTRLGEVKIKATSTRPYWQASSRAGVWLEVSEPGYEPTCASVQLTLAPLEGIVRGVDHDGGDVALHYDGILRYDETGSYVAGGAYRACITYRLVPDRPRESPIRFEKSCSRAFTVLMRVDFDRIR